MQDDLFRAAHERTQAWLVDRRNFLRLGGTLAAGVVVASAAGPAALALTNGTLADEMGAAAEQYGVPVELLLAMGYVNSLWEMPPPDASDYEPRDPEGRGTYGIMQLEQNPFRDTLGRAASLTGLSEGRLKKDRASNIEGGAALLSDIVGRTKPDGLDGWREAVGEYAGTDLYAGEVYNILKSGASLTISTGERVALTSQDVAVPQVYTAQVSADYPGSRWFGNGGSNYTNSNREASYNINRIVIHVAQGSYSGTINWFGDPANKGSSAHYVVSRTGRVAQCVRDEDIAWHAGWWRTNCHSIGIEHAGYVSNPRTFTNRMYRSSARLSAWCCKRYHIPIDRKHIIGHNQVPGCQGPGGGASCHTDPGKYWNWSRYMRLVRAYRRQL